MESLTVISDASSLIARSQIGLLDDLAPLFAECLIPPAVARETAQSVVRPTWIVEHPLNSPIDPRVEQAGLDPGETEAISLALELRRHVLVLDDLPARRFAESLGLPIIGTLAILVGAKRAGLIPAVRPSIEALLGYDFRASPRLIANILSLAEE